MWGLLHGYFLILPCNVTSEFGLSIVFLIRLPSHPFLGLNGLQYSCPSSQSLNFQLSTCTSHTRFGKSSSIVTERLSLMLVFLASFFLPCYILYGGYKPQRICKGNAISLKQWRCSRLWCLYWPTRDVYYLNFVQAHAHKWCKCHKR